MPTNLREKKRKKSIVGGNKCTDTSRCRMHFTVTVFVLSIVSCNEHNFSFQHPSRRSKQPELDMCILLNSSVGLKAATVFGLAMTKTSICSVTDETKFDVTH